MSTVFFQPAAREGEFLRMGLEGPAGSGKTKSAQLIMHHLLNPGERFCILDTEHRSANKYVGDDGIHFDIAYLDDNYDPQTAIDAIHAAEQAGYKGMIIDSLTHFWAGTGGILDMKDAKSKGSNSNNSYAAWRDVTPVHNKFVNVMLACALHLIVTLRTKTEYVMEEYQDGRGQTKTKPVKVGLKAIQRDGMDYEFDYIGDIDQEHNCVFNKTRCHLLDGKIFHKPGRDVANVLKPWLLGAKAMPAPVPAPAASNNALRAQLYGDITKAQAQVGLTKEQLTTWVGEKFNGRAAQDMSEAELASIPQMLVVQFAAPAPFGGNGNGKQHTGAINF